MIRILTFILSSLFLVSIAFAHESTDWRTDSKAFLSHQSDKNPIRALNSNEFKKTKSFEETKKEIMKNLRAFSGEDSVILNGKNEKISERKSINGKDLARAFLKEKFTALGFSTSEQNYSVLFGGKGKNFIAEKTGKDPSKILLISAHLDSVGNAGADDDGSGVIGALTIASLLKDKNFTYTLRFVGFDDEEKGLVGSTQYVKSLSQSEKNQIIGLINLEMLGYNNRKDGAFHVIDCDHKDSTFLSDSLIQSIKDQNLPLARSTACTDRSDHAAFWKAKIPAIVISQNFFGGDSNPCYHQSCDKVDIVNFDYMTQLVYAVQGTVIELLKL